MRELQLLYAVATIAVYALIVLGAATAEFATTSVTLLAPLSGSGGDTTALINLSALALGLTSIGVFGHYGFSFVGRHLDTWSQRRTAAESIALRDAARALGMQVERDPIGQHPVFVRRHATTWLRLHLTRRPHLVASHRLPLPAGFRLEAGSGGEPLGNAVLDALLRPENATDTGIDWTDAALTGLLLEALHGHPGSTLDAHTLKLHSIDAADLSAAAELSVALIDRLRCQREAR